MLNGITIAVVGMLTVFLFLAVLVLAMRLLNLFVNRFLPVQEAGEETTIVAAAVAAAIDAQERPRQ